jgi:hypothetical protein
MKYDDLKTLDLDKLIHDLADFSELNGICTLKGMIPMAVDEVSFSYQSDEDIEIYDERNNYLGILCICEHISEKDKDRYIKIESLTDAS